MIKKLVVFIIVLMILGIGGFFYVDNYIDKSLQPVDPNDDDKIIVEIPEGSSTNDIAEILYENDLINDTKVFIYYAKKTMADNNLRAGIYTLSKNMHTNEIIVELVYGGSSGNTANITIIEGLTLEETAKSIGDQLGLSYDKLVSLMEDAERFRNEYQFLRDNPNIKSLQGYLMPETYNVYVNSDEETIVKMLLQYFDDFYKSEMLSLIEKSALNIEEVVILASIVEKEAVLDEERDDVAATFLNRLDINMKLQSCATVNYAQGVWKERLSLDDIAIDSPYNTYVYEGLPPTPINSPGKLSIMAVLEPADVDYLFFVAKSDGSGSHYFSNNYDDHIKAANEYLN
ncbi:MAG: endolytic transglycosylase MltG [Tissierellia bacterium]|nr:endolytic transglycosylase MltG [Tissierellia bacterium]